MEVANKKVEHVVISLSPDEAEMLKAILNVSHVGVEENYPCDKGVIETFSLSLWEELDTLGVQDPLV